MLDECQQVGNWPLQRTETQNYAWEHSSVARDGSLQGVGTRRSQQKQGWNNQVANKTKVSAAMCSLGELRRKGLVQELKRYYWAEGEASSPGGQADCITSFIPVWSLLGNHSQPQDTGGLTFMRGLSSSNHAWKILLLCHSCIVALIDFILWKRLEKFNRGFPTNVPPLDNINEQTTRDRD